MRIIHVLRKPLSEGTVASNVVKHGCGGLNIDASRIESGLRLQTAAGGIEDGNIYGTADEYVLGEGRWPANVILQHLDGCRCDGVKRVKACGVGAVSRSTGKENGGQTGAAYGAESRTAGTEMVNYADEDGKETVANWVCVEGCPVARLDEQSGVSQSSRPNRVSGQFTQPGPKGLIYGFGFGIGWVSPTYNDTGGASRFYKQVGGKSDG